MMTMLGMGASLHSWTSLVTVTSRSLMGVTRAMTPLSSWPTSLRHDSGTCTALLSERRPICFGRGCGCAIHVGSSDADIARGFAGFAWHLDSAQSPAERANVP